MCLQEKEVPTPVNRLRVLTAHAAAGPVSEQGQGPAVGFDGKMFEMLQPLSPDAKGGAGREAWPDMKTGGASKTGWREHQEGRRAAETGSSTLWLIHSKLYDLEPFMDRHPGGRIWLELTRGTDATQGFEAYHLDGILVETVLNRYYVRDVRPGEFKHGDRFTYEETGFWRTLRRRVLDKLRSDAGPNATTQEATGATASMRAACAVVIAQFFVLHGAAMCTGSWLLAALAGVGLSGCWGVGHNFMHQSQAKAGLWQYFMDLTGMHAADWRVSHALSHHLDTNLETDWEYANLFPMYTNPNTGQGKVLPLAIPLFGVMRQLESAQYVRKTLQDSLTGKGRSIGKHVGHVLPGFLPFLQLVAYIRGRRSIMKGAALYLVQMMAFFLAFVPLSAGVHHATPDTDSAEYEELKSSPARNTFSWMEGQAGAEIDFGAHQVAATTDHSVLSDVPAFLRDWISLTFFGYLNNHTLHHLFPAVDASRLHALRSILEETAREFGLDSKNVKAWPIPSVYKGYFQYFMKREFRSRL